MGGAAHLVHYQAGQTPAVKQFREVIIPDTITVSELANRMTEKTADIVRELMKNGIMATATQIIDADTAEFIVGEFGHKAVRGDITEDKIKKIVTEEENDQGITKDVLKNQLEVVDDMDLENFIIAYEPVWAIGSGLTPDPKDINEIHKYIKDVVQSNSANKLIPRVLYGGSVTDKNAESFFMEEFVDGALVGGASLDGKTFANIVNIYNSTK